MRASERETGRKIGEERQAGRKIAGEGSRSRG